MKQNASIHSIISFLKVYKHHVCGVAVVFVQLQHPMNPWTLTGCFYLCLIIIYQPSPMVGLGCVLYIIAILSHSVFIIQFLSLVHSPILSNLSLSLSPSPSLLLSLFLSLSLPFSLLTQFNFNWENLHFDSELETRLLCPNLRPAQ